MTWGDRVVGSFVAGAVVLYYAKRKTGASSPKGLSLPFLFSRLKDLALKVQDLETRVKSLENR